MNGFVQLYGYTVLVSRRLRTLHPNICCYYYHQLACLLDFCSQFSSYCLRSMLSWNLTAFIYIRNLTLLLLQAGDIEINLGPRPIDPNPVICDVCNKKINRGINLETSATYYQEDCEVRCHQLCNGLTQSQTCHAKSKNKEIHWKCSQHGNGIAEVITPDQDTIFEVISRENHPSAAGKTCSVLRKTIQARYADSAYHCSVPSCTQVCHLTRTCSGYIEPRREVRDRILTTLEWKCQQHNDMRMKEGLPLGQQYPRQYGNLRTQQRHPIEQQHLRKPSTLRTQERQSIEQEHLQRNIALQTQGKQPTLEQHPRPAPPSLNDLRAHGMTFAEAKQALERCGKCSKKLRSNTVPVRCKLCAKGFHQKCSTGPHSSDCDEDWKCPNCAAKQNAQREAPAQDKNRIISQPAPSTS